MAAPKQGILTITISDKTALHAAYMPFVKNGGLFIPTTKPYHLGDEVFVLLTLKDSNERLPVAGRVIWITPRGAHGNRESGIGIQFNALDKGQTRHKIENYLGAALGSDRRTHTM